MKNYVMIIFLLLSNWVYANDSLYGIWQGSGIQDNSHWTIRIHAEKQFVMIDYPSLICGGILKPIKTNAVVFSFKENLYYGLTQCLTHGEVILVKISETQLRYHWFGKNGVLQATGDLIKVE